uniref:Uncharacterized protein n=1 Tax=Schistocephalus solidus TaxID=70667 RepID=A0A0X3NSP9_SCHSO
MGCGVSSPEHVQPLHKNAGPPTITTAVSPAAQKPLLVGGDMRKASVLSGEPRKAPKASPGESGSGLRSGRASRQQMEVLVDAPLTPTPPPPAAQRAHGPTYYQGTPSIAVTSASTAFLEGTEVKVNTSHLNGSDKALRNRSFKLPYKLINFSLRTASYRTTRSPQRSIRLSPRQRSSLSLSRQSAFSRSESPGPRRVIRRPGVSRDGGAHTKATTSGFLTVPPQPPVDDGADTEAPTDTLMSDRISRTQLRDGKGATRMPPAGRDDTGRKVWRQELDPKNTGVAVVGWIVPNDR